MFKTLREKATTESTRKIIDQMLKKPNLAFAIPKILPLAAVGLGLGATYFSGTYDGTIISVVPTKAIHWSG
jgi:hypothetical protein